MSELSVAIIGASQDRRKYGNKAVRAYHDSGYRVYPINPNEAVFEGLRSFPTIDAVP
jgi:predicted CoA-binding protein